MISKQKSEYDLKIAELKAGFEDMEKQKNHFRDEKLKLEQIID